ncbi:aldo/keto reductase [Paraburkholderia solisilvae]|uniref:1-deoxyxylulose-5-phosphate synthase YajO n=1 Tax=Paraburkholderia solisilvae TaxID=624376 RepID=A0A6J5E7L7_9BURK|nr:aldo/keto reductase [Paraburkholderia solisilvae]CAB3761301.1 1-deoxyxylulose-5-phosphate synthase YajO [Paraburkholderia solisilvae]
MPLDSYVTLGRSGLRVSPLCLGTMTFGEDWNFGSNVADSQAILSRFIERGGNFLDTADIYTKGHSEKIIGDFLAGDRSRRDRLVIGTKFASNLYPGDPNGGGSSAKAMIRACEQSLRRLRTDYIDLYWLHGYDVLTPIDETMRALDNLVTSGKVRYLGFCNTPAWRVCQAQMLNQMNGFAPLIATQVEYSLVERSVEHEIVPMAQTLGLAVMPWAPLKSGVLSGKYARSGGSGRATVFGIPIGEREHVLIDALRAIADKHHTSVAAVALAWLSTQPGVGPVIIGARTLEQLDENVQSLDVALAADEIAELGRMTAPAPTSLSQIIAQARPAIQNGLTVNGFPSTASPFAPTTDDDRY